MIYLIDTCCFTNFYNCDGIEVFLDGCNVSKAMGELSFDEAFCHSEQRLMLHESIKSGKIEKLPSSEIDFDDFQKLKEELRLGDGETECIFWANKIPNSVVCTDDARARKKAELYVGEKRVTGSLGILKSGVECNLLNTSDAFKLYRKMIVNGAFLPQIGSLEKFEISLNI